MSPMTESLDQVERADELGGEAREALRDLILVLADSKRVLGIRYSDWMLGAPTLETGIAASSMAQDEWGHGRLTYALLSDFGDRPGDLEHEREGSEYRSPELLDQRFVDWSEATAAGLLFDTALTTQYGALLDSRYAPAHNRVQKMLDEETFHFRHAVSWARRLADTPAIRENFHGAVRRILPVALRWLGREEWEGNRVMVDEQLVSGGPDDLRRRFLGRVGPVLAEIDMAEELVPHDDGWRFTGELAWAGWDDAKRRAGGTGPDADTLSRVRGDKNRAFLVE
jgi:phenylacetate-CoA oxygenase PaaI subunit